MFVVEAGKQWVAKRREQPGWYRDASKNVTIIKREIDEWLYDAVGGVVQTGPFEGMKIMREISWKDTRLAPYLLGCYEEELHGELERQIHRLQKLAKPKISVVGCAEGYYAIGLKRRVPHADVFVVDSDEKALEICEHAAKANEVQLIARAPCEVYMENTDFLLMDVEGSEVEYMDCNKFPSLKQVTAIVEIHNYAGNEQFAAQKTDDILLDRFRGSHRIAMFFEGPRDPNRYMWLCGMTSDYRWLAISEGRTCLMGWFVMQPRGLSLS